jgi:hypothetical protein
MACAIGKAGAAFAAGAVDADRAVLAEQPGLTAPTGALAVFLARGAVGGEAEAVAAFTAALAIRALTTHAPDLPGHTGARLTDSLEADKRLASGVRTTLLALEATTPLLTRPTDRRWQWRGVTRVRDDILVRVIADIVGPIADIFANVLTCVGLVAGVFLSTADAQQGSREQTDE